MSTTTYARKRTVVEPEPLEGRTANITNYAGKRVTVMGLGLFGGGVGAARFFASHGARVTVTDERPAKDLQPSVDALRPWPIHFVLDRHDEADFRNADIVVINPGVRPDHPLVQAARATGAQIERSMNLLFKLTPKNPKLAVTGSNGKSTTTALLAEMLRLHDPRTLLGGNIGKCLLSEVEQLPAGAPLILELSSFMLMGLGDLGQSPQVSIMTNLSPNHLNWHLSMEEYAAAKRNIFAFQRPGDLAILNADDPALAGWEDGLKGRVLPFSVKTAPKGNAAFLDGDKLVVRYAGTEFNVALRKALRLPGTHNVANALAASAAALAFGVKPGLVTEALENFAGLPHRLEMIVRTPQAVTFYNDSIATTPESVICALNTFDGPITLIAGGSPKDTPFDELGVAIVRKVRRLILLGLTGPKIEAAVVAASEKLKCGPQILHARDLEHAAWLSATDALPGEVVLLSPASASFDMFRNFEERGDLFRVLARRLAAR